MKKTSGIFILLLLSTAFSLNFSRQNVDVIPLANSLSLGDYNNDGQLDILVGADGRYGDQIRAYSYVGNSWDRLSITIPSPCPYTVNLKNVYDVQTGDIDNDGQNELVVLFNNNFTVFKYTSWIAIYKNMSGTWENTYNFSQFPDINNIYGLPSIQIGDVNGDGKNELVLIPTRSYPNIFYVLENETGGWTTTLLNLSSIISATGNILQFVVTDVYGTGSDEIVFGAETPGDNSLIAIAKNESGGWTINNVTGPELYNNPMWTFSVGDINNDSKNEIVAKQNYDLAYFSNVSGGWNKTTIVPPYFWDAWLDSDIGDFDNDNNVEFLGGIYCGYDSTVTIYRNDGSWTQEYLNDSILNDSGYICDDAYASGTLIRIGDVNGDGKNELVALSFDTWWGSVSDYSLFVYTFGNQNQTQDRCSTCSTLNRTQMSIPTLTGGFDGNTSIPSSTQLISMDAGDANNDGQNETVVGTIDGKLRMYSYSLGIWSETDIDSNDSVRALKIGDVDNDGLNELVVSTTSNILMYKPPAWTKTIIAAMSAGSLAIGANNSGSNELVADGQVFSLNGGTWVQDTAFAGSPVAIGDVNKDGKNEVIVASGWDVSNYNIHVCSFVSVGNWSCDSTGLTGEAVNSLAIGDVNYDGQNEIIAALGDAVGGNPFDICYDCQTWALENISGGWVQLNLPSGFIGDVYHSPQSSVFFADGNYDGIPEVYFGSSVHGEGSTFWGSVAEFSSTQLRGACWQQIGLQDFPLTSIYSLVISNFDGGNLDAVLVMQGCLDRAPGFTCAAENVTNETIVYYNITYATIYSTLPQMNVTPDETCTPIIPPSPTPPSGGQVYAGNYSGILSFPNESEITPAQAPASKWFTPTNTIALLTFIIIIIILFILNKYR